jgi:3-dehydroquinate synthase
MNSSVTAEETVLVELPDRTYHILIGRRLLDSIESLAHDIVHGDKVMIVADAAVESPWGKKMLRALRETDYDVELFIIPSGETSKSPEVLMQLWERLAAAGFTRDSAIIALGGGVTGDLAGFAAASFLRGINYIQVPTTLLAMVDSSVGGKTGINLASGKNLVGAFWQPSLVIIDLDVLGTLPDAARTSGLAEIIKYGVIHDADLFATLEREAEKLFVPGHGELLASIVRRSVEIKALVVGADEREAGLRAILNFGHTLGHAIEAETHYTRYSHGEAVAMGMVAASLIAVRRGGTQWTSEEHGRLVALIGRAGLPTAPPADVSAEALVARTYHDKKVKSGVVRYVLPTRVGKVELVRDVTDEMVLAVLRELGCA